VGDSHALALSYNLRDAFEASGISGTYLSIRGCQTIPTLFRAGSSPNEACSGRFATLLEFVSDEVDAVIVVNRWSFKLYPIEGEIESLSFNNGDGGVETGVVDRGYVALDEVGEPSFSEQSKQAVVETFLNGFLGTGKDVILVYPIPATGWDIYKMNLLHFNGGAEPRILDDVSISAELVERRNRLVNGWFDNIEAENLVRVKPALLLCDTFFAGRCAVQVDGLPLYYDDDHLSYAGGAGGQRDHGRARRSAVICR
jgi:hypothetical protein